MYNNSNPPINDHIWKYTRSNETDIVKTWIKYGYIPSNVLPKYQS